MKISGIKEKNITTMHTSVWRPLAEGHKHAVSMLVDKYLLEKTRHAKNPVVDFMFTYYNFRPAALKRWTPGAGVLLENGAEFQDFDQKGFQRVGNDIELTADSFPPKRVSGLKWIKSVLENSQNTKPLLNCCGMHEWAMVYKTDDIRHDRFALRLTPAEIQDFVESRPVQCTHFDAFRFFTDAARPLNQNKLSRDNFHFNEQPGCLHTNMDLYKWSYKLYPWVSSETILQAFKLAMEARELDMKAGPYDLTEIGFHPIKIETEEGRIEYKRKQAVIWKKGIPIRSKLLKEVEYLLNEKDYEYDM